MKKVLLGILMAAMLVSFCGCKDMEPSIWDIDQDDDWEIWAEGKIIRIMKVENPRCSNGVDCSGHVPIDAYIFEDGKEVEIGGIRNPGTIRAGQYGTLYKRNLGSADGESWFQWRVNKNIPVTVARKPQPISINTKPNDFNINIVDDNKSVWINSSQKNPERYTPVLVKFKNDTISVGYINNINEWKLSINRRLDDGGKTIAKTEIIFWKSVDLD